ncbi:hypothetical protein K1719_046676 [Acacia pycnantha]|nr:hypothetical protein K1719_046676 [Acacia pycnantha]
MQCLIYTDDIPSDATIFCNLVELRLHDMLVRELCRGDFPIEFLKQLEKLNLSHCGKLDGILFKGKLELSNLKSVELMDCSMTCLLHLSTAQSLRQLENLCIIRCSKLKCLISDDERAEQKVDDHQDPNQKNHHAMFLKLKFLKVQECHELEFILPISPCKELESVEIHDCNELNYIFGQCPNEGELYQMEMETILPLLSKIKIANVPKFINIYPEYHLSQPSQVQKSWGPMCCFSSKASALNIDEQSFSKANQLDHTQASKEKHLCRVGGLFTSPLYPFQNLRQMSIEGFSELKSLLTLSIASSLKLMETLKVNECAFYSRDFKHLERVDILKADKMKYVFGKCRADEDHNVQSELALPALKELWLNDVLNMVSICTKNYSVKALSLQDIYLNKCPQLPINSVMDFCGVDGQKREDLLKRKEKGKQEFTCLDVTKASKAKSSDPSAAHEYFPPPLNQFKLRKIELTGLSRLTSLFTISIASSLKLLETLKIGDCDALQHIITDEGPNSHGQMIVPSFFPRLQEVFIWRCNNLEYVFPAFYSKDFKDLKKVFILEAKRIEYVVGKCRADQDHNVQSKLNFPALKMLWLQDVQNMALSFKERGRPLSNSQELCDSRDIYVEPKKFFSFQNLYRVVFAGCKQLQFILSASTARSMPELKALFILDCEELVSIIEDDKENQQNPFDPHQSCFPQLHRIEVKQCKKLKCLFSISTCPKLPSLQTLEIEDAPELVQVFEWKQGAPQELVIKDVLPNLLGIRLVNLPSLHTIYQGIDFQTLKVRLVRDCGNIPSANVSSSELFDFLATLHPNLFRLVNTISDWVDQSEEASKEADEKDSTIQKQESSSPNLTEIEEEGSQEDIVNGSTMPQQNNASPNFEKNTVTPKNEIVDEQLPTSNAAATPSSKSNRIEKEGSQQDIVNDSTMPQHNNDGLPKFENSEEVSKEIVAEDSTTNINLPNLTKSTITSANETVEEKFTYTISYRRKLQKEGDLYIGPKEIQNLENTEYQEMTLKNLKATFGGPSSEKYGKASSSKESMDDDQQAHGESRSSNEAPQRIEEPTKEWSSKETSNEVSLKIPPPSVTEMTFALLQRERIMNQPESSTTKQAVHDDNELIKALADLEGSLKMSLNEIASSKESRFRLENALNILSSHCFEHGAPSHGLQTTIHNLQQEIQNVLSSSKQAYATIDTFNKLEHQEKLFTEERSKRKEAAVALLPEIYNKESSLAEASLKEEELKEQISKLQAELDRKEKQVQEHEMELISLKEQKKKSVYDTMGFIKEFEAVKKERSHMVEENMKAKEHLQNMDVKWSSCLSNMKKTTLLLGVHLQQKL